MEKIQLVQIGAGGYGEFYMEEYLSGAHGNITLAGVVDPFIDRCSTHDTLLAKGIPVFDDLEAFYAEHSAELAVIASPIQFHLQQTTVALQNGSHVLCEKPLGATWQEVQQMIAARDAADRFVAIGFQASFSVPVQQLKADIMSGRFGAPKRLKTIALWRRFNGYYERASWAGQLRTPDGDWVLDSPANNATAHYLHNSLYVIGPEVDRSATPATVSAELYRANDITGFDTSATRIMTTEGVEILFYTSHAADDKENLGPVFHYEFEDATVQYEIDNSIVAHHNGEVIDTYGDPCADSTCKLIAAADAAAGNRSIVCGPEAAGMQTLCINGMHESMPNICQWPADLITMGNLEEEHSEQYRQVTGLRQVLKACYDQNQLPAECGTPWAVAGDIVDMRGYEVFPRDPTRFP
jgi:predicted dehydrogenase